MDFVIVTHDDTGKLLTIYPEHFTDAICAGIEDLITRTRAEIAVSDAIEAEISDGVTLP